MQSFKEHLFTTKGRTEMSLKESFESLSLFFIMLDNQIREGCREKRDTHSSAHILLCHVAVLAPQTTTAPPSVRAPPRGVEETVHL